MASESNVSIAGTGCRVDANGQPASQFAFTFGEFGETQFFNSVAQPYIAFFVQTPSGIEYSGPITLNNDVFFTSGITEDDFSNGYARITVDVPDAWEYITGDPLPAGSTFTKIYYMDFSDPFAFEDEPFSDIVYDFVVNGINAVPNLKSTNPKHPSTLQRDCNAAVE